MNIIRQFLVFCGVGMVNTAVGYGVIALLTLLSGWHYILNNMLGYGAGLVVAFVLHRQVTFRASIGQTAARQQVLPFLLLFAVCYALQLAALWLMIVRGEMPELLAQFFAVAMYAVLNFLGSRFFVFTCRSSSVD